MGDPIEISDSAMLDKNSDDSLVCNVRGFRFCYDVFQRMRHTSHNSLIVERECATILVKTVIDINGEVILRNIWINFYRNRGVRLLSIFDDIIELRKTGLTNMEIQNVIKL